MMLQIKLENEKNVPHEEVNKYTMCLKMNLQEE